MPFIVLIEYAIDLQLFTDFHSKISKPIHIDKNNIFKVSPTI